MAKFSRIIVKGYPEIANSNINMFVQTVDTMNNYLAS